MQTVDFFTPIVDDPYVYGQIAAANAVSDIYAMGGRPLTALRDRRRFRRTGSTPTTIRAIFRGGFDKLREAGVVAARRPHGAGSRNQVRLRGHRRDRSGRACSPTPARSAGDVLFLTKPLGTGIVGTAIKFDRVDRRWPTRRCASMRTLNRAAAEALQALPAGAVHACTDVTGFGLHRARHRDGAGERGDA